MDLGEYFAGNALAKTLFDAIAKEIHHIGPASLRVTKSQVAFRRRRNVAVLWMPGRYLKEPAAPLVLTLSLAKRDGSSRWKEVVQVSPQRYTHHLELHRIEDINAQVGAWLRSAWEAAA
jgi:hypothetical protein